MSNREKKQTPPLTCKGGLPDRKCQTTNRVENRIGELLSWRSSQPEAEGGGRCRRRVPKSFDSNEFV